MLAFRLHRPGVGEPVGRTVVAPLLYAVHPALVEGAAFIAGRFDLLLTTFLLLALLADHALRALAVGGCALLAALSTDPIPPQRSLPAFGLLRSP